jgi:hypothetical protein
MGQTERKGTRGYGEERALRIRGRWGWWSSCLTQCRTERREEEGQRVLVRMKHILFLYKNLADVILVKW